MNAIERHWDRVGPWLDELFEIAAPEREAWLRSRCDEPALRAEVLALLVEETAGAHALDEIRRWLGAAPLEGQQVGPYRLVRHLGDGGMGSVHLAERETAEFTQRVALKLLRIGAVSPSQIELFRREQQIHAALGHPHIARVLDSGITAGGVPYFALEYVDGAPIDRHCDERSLGIDARLRLLLPVCDAVQFAHQNLVVHRDLKPSNILVTHDGEPKLLDFGIAKLLADPNAATSPTATGTALLTPAYAAPEQFRGGPITTATDVYALGVVLVELLTGRRPAPADTATSSTQRAPSRLAADVAPDVAARRGLDPVALRRRLKGDLDWIAARALDPDPTRRYPGAGALADDLRRHLEGRPIRARPDSLAYRTGKFVRRNAAAVGVAALAAVSLIGATAFSIAQAERARREATRAASEAARAETEAARANAAKTFLLQLFVQGAPGSSAPPDTAAEMLERGQAEALRQFEGQPELQVEVLGAIGDVERQRGNLAAARAPLERAVELARRHFGDGDRRTLDRTLQLASLDDVEGLFVDAERRIERALMAYRERHTDSNKSTVRALEDLGIARMRQGRFDEALDAIARAVAAARAMRPSDDEVLAHALLAHGDTLVRSGRPAEAQAALAEALVLNRAVHGTEHAIVETTLSLQANALRAIGRLGEAEAADRESLRIAREIYPVPHASLVGSLHNLGTTLAMQGRIGEAKALFGETLAQQRALYAGEHPFIATTLCSLGMIEFLAGRPAEAARRQREGLDLMRRTRGPEHPLVARCSTELARSLTRAGELDAADAALVESARINATRFTAPHPALAADRLARAELLLARADASTAADEARAAIADYERLVLPGHPRLLEARLVRARSLRALAELGEARTALETALQHARSATPPVPATIARLALELARVERADGRAGAAATAAAAAAAALDGVADRDPALLDEIARERALAGG